MDALSGLIQKSRISATLERRCLLASSTDMVIDAESHGQAAFHVVLAGTCEVQVEGALLNLAEGDVVVIPDGLSHRVLTAGTGVRRGVSEATSSSLIATTTAGEGDVVLDLFCGHFRFGPGAGSILFNSLPKPLHVSLGTSPEGQEALTLLSQLMRAESQVQLAGTAAILDALSTVLLAMVLRSSNRSAENAELWTAISDPRIASVVSSVLRTPGDDWSLERLARVAAMSRASFIRHFRARTGMTVGEFVHNVRAIEATHLLLTSEDTVASVAGQVGYRSESSFSRAFRELVGETPGEFRRTRTRSQSRG